MKHKAHASRILLLGGPCQKGLESVLGALWSCVCVDSLEKVHLELSREDFDAILVDASAIREAIGAASDLGDQYPDRAIFVLSETEPQRLAAQSAGLDTVDAANAGSLSERLTRLSARRKLALAASRTSALALQNGAYKELFVTIAKRVGREQIAVVAADVAQRLLLAGGAALGEIVGAELCCIGASGQMSAMKGMTAPTDGFEGILAGAGGATRLTCQEPFSPELARIATEGGIGSAAISPVRGPRGVIGILAVTAAPADAFADTDLRSLQGIADLVGIGFSLADAENLRASFLRDVVSGIDDERRRIARDLHDEAGQLLTGLLVNLHALEKDSSRGPKSPLAVAQQLASRALVELQRIARGLTPGVMTDLAFEQVVRRLADEHQRTHRTTVDVVFNGLLTPPELPTEVQVALYRIVQEALTNIARHARAEAVSILVRRADGTVNMIIEDDGAGMDVSAKSAGAGLRNIAERIALLRGKFTLESAAEMGTALYVEIPIGGPDGEDQGADR